MNNNTKDLLQIKIDQARAQLPEDTLRAIDAVDWRAAILELRQKKGYTIEQLENLETETELVLCGLVIPENYPRELEKRMGLSKNQVNDLVSFMNNQVFSKIREALIKNTEGKKEMKEIPQIQKKEEQVLGNAGIKIIPAISVPEKKEVIVENKEEIMKSAGIEIVPEKAEKPLPKEEHPILAQKLSGFTKNEVVQTEHSLENITKGSEIPTKSIQSKEAPKSYSPNTDPYRLPPE